MTKRRPRKVRPPSAPGSARATERTRVGNLGCVRFPLPIRKASGIKRGDRLSASTGGDAAVILSKVPAPLPEEALLVDECACREKPEGCSVPMDYLAVGWSYVQFDDARARALGLLPGTPLTLVAEPSRITVSIDRPLADDRLDEVSPVRCPP